MTNASRDSTPVSTTRVDPKVKKCLDVEGHAVRTTHVLEQDRVAERGIAIRDDHETIAIEHHLGLKRMVRPQDVEGGSGGEDLEVARRNHEGRVVDGDQLGARLRVEDADGDRRTG